MKHTDTTLYKGIILFSRILPPYSLQQLQLPSQ